MASSEKDSDRVSSIVDKLIELKEERDRILGACYVIAHDAGFSEGRVRELVGMSVVDFRGEMKRLQEENEDSYTRSMGNDLAKEAGE